MKHAYKPGEGSLSIADRAPKNYSFTIANAELFEVVTFAHSHNGLWICYAFTPKPHDPHFCYEEKAETPGKAFAACLRAHLT